MKDGSSLLTGSESWTDLRPKDLKVGVFFGLVVARSCILGGVGQLNWPYHAYWSSGAVEQIYTILIALAIGFN